MHNFKIKNNQNLLKLIKSYKYIFLKYNQNKTLICLPARECTDKLFKM